MEQDVITLLCPINAAPGRGSELALALKRLAVATENEAGNVFYVPHRTEDPDRFIIIEQWKNQAALDSHMQEPHLIAFLEDKDRLLAEEPNGQPLWKL